MNIQLQEDLNKIRNEVFKVQLENDNLIKALSDLVDAYYGPESDMPYFVHRAQNLLDSLPRSE